MKYHQLLAISSIALGLLVGDVTARGIRGGGGGGGRAGGGGARPGGGGGGARPAARPSAPSRPSAPNLGGGGGGRPNISAPSRPSISRPSVSRPSGGPSLANRPNLPSGGGFKPPSSIGNRPSLPSGGIANRPNISLPSGGNRPNFSLPSGGSPNFNLPSSRPSIPSLGGGGISNRPGISMPGGGIGGGSRPGISLPNQPGGGIGGGSRPGINLPNQPGGGIAGGNRPNFPGGGARPSPGDLGDFLGMDKPLRPSTLPGLPDGGLANLPNRPGDNFPNRPDGNFPNRPDGNFPNRPDGGLPNRPDIGRPGNNLGDRVNLGDRNNIGGRTNIGDRVNIGDIRNRNNNIINNRPNWLNIDNNRFANINANWGNQIGGLRNWGARYPGRVGYWNGWADGVRSNWHGCDYGWFGGDWWSNHSHDWCGWHYGYAFNDYPWNYWWTYPTYSDCTDWFSWSAPSDVWSQPIYYDYGTGGNVVYEDNSVYINGQQIATADEFAQSAATLATVPPPTSEQQAAQAEWLPLGTFAVSAGEQDVDPTRVIQLAVDKQGVVSGTLYNSQTDQAQTVQGRVDKQTQRVAMRIGDSQDIIVETGLYNLTQENAPVLVHFGPEKVENWLFVRLDNPENKPGS